MNFHVVKYWWFLDVIVCHSALVATGLTACYLKSTKSISKPEREITTIITPCIYFAPGHVFIKTIP